MLHDPSPVYTLPDHNIVPRMTTCTVSNVTVPNPGATYSVPIHTSCCFPTPINTSRLSHLLKSHPDQSFVSYVCNGLSSGFRIEYSAPLSATPVIAPNLATADLHCDHITTYLQKCCQTQETAGPFTSMPFPAMHCSGLGVVPKKNGKLRIINVHSPCSSYRQTTIMDAAKLHRDAGSPPHTKLHAIHPSYVISYHKEKIEFTHFHAPINHGDSFRVLADNRSDFAKKKLKKWEKYTHTHTHTHTHSQSVSLDDLTHLVSGSNSWRRADVNCDAGKMPAMGNAGFSGIHLSHTQACKTSIYRATTEME